MRDLHGTATTAETGQVHVTTAAGGAAAAARRRITADSFRLLTARLKSKDAIPDFFEEITGPEPQAIAAEAIVPVDAARHQEIPPAADRPAERLPPPAVFGDIAAFALPEFVPLSDLPAEAAAPQLPEEPEDDAVHPAAAEPAAQPEAVAESGEQLFTPQDEPVEDIPAPVLAPDDEPSQLPVDEAPAETLLEAIGQPEIPAPEIHAHDIAPPEPPPELPWLDLAAPEPEPVEVQLPAETGDQETEPESPLLLQPAPEPEVQPKPARGVSPLADKVVDALVKTVTEAVYAKPTAAERAAFLREVAALVEADNTQDETPAPANTDSPADVAPYVATPAPEPEAAPAVPTEDLAPAAPPEISSKIADRLGSATSILKKPESLDPFAQIGKSAFKLPPAVESQDADEDTGELALSLLDMMTGGNTSSQPQERALAADTLLRLVPKIPVRQLLAIAERVSIMETPPNLLVARLIRDPRPEIAAPLLERCMHISDQDLAAATADGDVHKLRMIARRRQISPTLSDQLIDRDDTSVILTLVRNPGAALNHHTFFRLADHAVAHHAVLAPLATRADLPAPVAFELFWHVPQELRRFILSRFLTDSENLNRILKITMATQGGDSLGTAEPKFPPREQLDQALVVCAGGAVDEGGQVLADLAGIAHETALRVLSDGDGEPLAVLLKTLGYPRSRFTEAMESLQRAEVQFLRPDRKIEELQSIFDTLSFNKARILVTYWDWFVRKAGPYAPQN